jgi:hypothetical protein
MTSAEELPGEVKAALSECESSLETLEAVLEPLLSTPWETLTAKLDSSEKARLNLMMAYATSSLYFIYLKTQVSDGLCKHRHNLVKRRLRPGEVDAICLHVCVHI